MTSIDLARLDIDQLQNLVGDAQTEIASREKQRRKDLRSELERRVAADGYKMPDIFPELGSANGSGARRQKRPVKYRNSQNPGESWSGIGRTPKWVQAILEERGIDAAAFKSIPMCQIHTYNGRSRQPLGLPDYVPSSACVCRPQETGVQAATQRRFRRLERRFAVSGEPSRSIAYRVRSSAELRT